MRGQNLPTSRDRPPALFRPADVARVLGKSEWWVKEQARRGRIPFTKPGRAYRFTSEHIAEIVRLYEWRPEPAVARPPVRAAPAPAAKASLPAPSVRLRARLPRRVAANLDQQQNAA
ncbi:helix-turn-helix domain-containing protein [Kitasatospora sp. NPDC088346]|uniref:helix-turn-helix domain-containing protein n=1 Tax=Kitasatospora sp. NPDC088346 TaxID=3364073 RepID=UPI0038103914